MKFTSKSKPELPDLIDWLGLLWPGLLVGLAFFIMELIIGESLQNSVFKGISITLLYSLPILFIALFGLLFIWYNGRKIFKRIHAIEFTEQEFYYSYQPFIKKGITPINQLYILATWYLDNETVDLSFHKKSAKEKSNSKIDIKKMASDYWKNDIGSFKSMALKDFDAIKEIPNLEMETWPSLKKLERVFADASYDFDFYTANDEAIEENSLFEVIEHLKKLKGIEYLGENEMLNKTKTSENTEYYFVYEMDDLLASITVYNDSVEIECSKNEIPKTLIMTFEKYNLILDNDE